VARGSVQRRFLQRPRWSSLDLDRNHGVAETSSFCEYCGREHFQVTLAALIRFRSKTRRSQEEMVEWVGVDTLFG
jgi:hypothetical protein